ncbi:MAG TPA: hypothetical protein PLA51_09680 [Spirochaetota bacterium]|nr:hypothetical protein [Spirochaetota bacterium]HRU64432.1 hypothetical protein [Spirochaetota bacterium]
MKANNNDHKAVDIKVKMDKCTIAPHPEMVRNYDADEPCEME